jgi:hypothetical protein
MENNSTTKIPLEASENEQRFIIEEYKTLRQEILNHQQFAHQINTTGIAIGTAVLAILTIKSPVFSNKTEIMAFLLAGLTIFYFFLILAQVNRQHKEIRIGRYIEIMIEQEVRGLHWESSWHRGQWPKFLKHSAIYEVSPLLILQFLYGVATIWTLYQFKDLRYQCALIIFLFLLILMLEIWLLFNKKSKVDILKKEWENYKKNFLRKTK